MHKASKVKKFFELFWGKGDSQGGTPDKEVIAYCHIGERSSQTWFVLKCFKNVKNQDGS